MMDNWSYESLSDGTIRITDAKEATGEITIPDVIDGQPVTEIGPGAFKGSGITAVTIPASVKKLGDHAFEDCRSLKTVSLSEGLEEICEDAFRRCLALETLEIPSTAHRLDSDILSGCYRVRSLTLHGDLWSRSVMRGNRCVDTHLGPFKESNTVVTFVLTEREADRFIMYKTLPRGAQVCAPLKIPCVMRCGDEAKEKKLDKILKNYVLGQKLREYYIIASMIISFGFFLALWFDVFFIKSNTMLWICWAGMVIFFAPLLIMSLTNK